jgi:hypothetical protein
VARERTTLEDRARALPDSRAIEPDTLDAETRAGMPAEPLGDRYLSSERVVERQAVADADAAPAAANVGDRLIRFPRSVEDENDERRRVVLEEVVVRRRAVDPSELTPAERTQLAENPNATIRREV